MASPERERSVKQMIGRVVDTIGGWGRDGGYFATDEEADTFEAELKAILVNQFASFNSPVWFNVGFEEKPQCSRLLHPLDRRLDGVDPRLDPPRGHHLPRRLGLGRQPLAPALLEGAALEGRLRLRPGLASCAAPTRPPARSSRAARRGARRRWSCSTSTTRTSRSSSGARPRRSARRASSSRPATTCRSTRPTGRRSSTRTRTTRSASRTSSWRRSIEGKEWNLTARTDGSVVETTDARDLLRQIAEAAWQCADPGVQYDTTINSWHTLPNTGRINASNPCSEYMSIDDSACNLASLNLMKFRREDGELDVEAFEHAVDVVFLAQEIVVGYSSYPTPEIEQQREGVPPARPRLREPRRAADGARPPVRLRRGSRLRGRDHRAHDRPRLPQVGRDRAADGPVRRLPAERGRDDRRHREAPRGGRQHRHTRLGAGRPARRRRAARGTTRSTSARSPASATRRRPCSRRPGRSAS